jgi:hypothetical protein
MLALNSSQFDPDVWSGGAVKKLFVSTLADAVLRNGVREPNCDGEAHGGSADQ